MASATYDKLAKKADSALTSLKNFKQKAALSERRMLTAGEALVGGALGGIIDGKWGEGSTHETWGIPTVAALGGAAVVAGLSERVPGGEDILAIGTGMLSYAGGNYIKDAIGE